jgi:O-antigen/teichoic acid export membrane protein
MKENKFYSSLGLLILLNAVIKPLWIFGIDRQVQNAVGLEAYGVYFSLFNFSVVFGFLLDWGLTTFFNRYLAAHREVFIDHIGNFLLIKILFIIIYVIVVFTVAYISHIRRVDILWGVMAIQVLTSMFVFLRSIVTAEHWFRTDAWLSVLDKTLMILLCGSLLFFPMVFGKMNIQKFLVVQISCTFFAVVSVLAVLLRRGVNFTVRTDTLPDFELLKKTIPFAFILLLMSVHNRLDGFLLERISTNGAYEAGLYATAYRLLDAANMLGYLLASFLLPYMARQWSTGKNITDIVLTGRHLLIIFVLPLVITTIFLAPWIQQTLYHHDDMDSIAIMQWCLPALLGYALVQVYGTAMTAAGYAAAFCYINLVAVVINITMNVILIPQMGARACCLAALCSQGFAGLACMIYTRQRMRIPFHFRSGLMYIFIAAVLCGFFYSFNRLVSEKWLLVAGAVVITGVMAIVTRLFKVHLWKNLIRNQPYN